MPDGADRRDLDAARQRLAGVTEAARRLGLDVARGAAALERLRRQRGADDPRVRAAEAEQARREEALAGARAAVVGARGELGDRLDGWLGEEPSIDIGRLRADTQLVLLPVRLETRFARAGHAGELLIRIYPDAIHASSHDPLLTEAERDLAIAFWQRAWAGDEAQAWREVVRQIPAPRAAWIVRAAEPTNIGTRPEGEPVFPDVELRAHPWDRPSEAHLLPDRWLALAFRGDVQVRAGVSRPVVEPLAVGFDPQAPPGQGVDISGDGLVLEDEVLWAVDFPRAEAAGMALRLPLAPADLEQGFDRLLVIGMKASLSPEDGQQRLAELLDGHHYAGGLAVLAQGTPTNNTEGAPSAYPPPDPDGARSFAIERGAPLDTPDGDGARLTRALGVPPSVVGHVAGADRREQVAARAMNQALWPVTFGYFLQQMLAPHVGADAIELGRHHFVDRVRGRGPLPAVRVRAQPYGVLPVASLDRWQPRRGADRADVRLPDLLRRLRPAWRAQAGNVPRVGRTADADADLLAILGMDASAREVRVRQVHGPDFRRNFFAFAGIDGATWEQAQIDFTGFLMPMLGFPEWNPRLLHVHFADAALRFRFPLVAPAPLSETAGLEAVFGFDYIRWIREASIDDLRNERLPEGRQPPAALLYRMLRHARLAELARVGIDLQIKHGLATAAERHEPELVGIAVASATRPTIWQRFDRPIPPLTGTLTLGEFLVSGDAPETTTLREYEDALAALQGLPTAELERLFGETLDVSSHRLDAWITSLAAKRLDEMREASPGGVYVGAYGWVEGLRPEPAGRSRTTRLPDGRAAQVPAVSGGFIQAPSMQHAAAAAVLRNGHLTRSGEAGAAFAVNLSSARVRAALAVLDAVREGQPLGAVLGYRVERGLHDRRVDWFIEPLRRRFPAVANKSGDPDTDGAPDAIAARAVVDGVALRAAWVAGALDLGASDFFRAGMPPTAAERAAVEAELARLDETVDAVADLLTAESVYQLVNGNTAGANAGLDATARGTRPPDPEVAAQPRPGIPLTHRVMVVLGGAPPEAPGWTAAPTPRALAEPWVDGWIGRLMGDPHAARCRVRLELPAAGGAPPTHADVIVTLDALELRPLDVLALARAATEGPAPLAELDARVAEAALAAGPPGARVAGISYARDPAWSLETVRAFAEIFEIARAADRLLAVSRPLAAGDLGAPEGSDPAGTGPVPDPLAGEAAARAGQARDRLAAARDALAQAADPAALRSALRGASRHGIAGAHPQADAPDAALPAATERALAEMERRLAEAAGAPDAPAIVRAVLGPGAPFLPRLTPPRPEELAQALAAGPAMVGDADAPRRWAYQASRVRAPLARWRALALRAGALGTDVDDLSIAQLPHRPGAAWIALPFAPGGEPRARTLSIAMRRLAAPAADEPWVGLLVDEWNEVIPATAPTTGIAFHFDSPGAEAPQAVLVAVPSAMASPARGSDTNAAQWELADLVATLGETLDLAKLRGVDLELLGALGPLVPAVYLAANAANDTVSTDWRGHLVADAPLVAIAEEE